MGLSRYFRSNHHRQFSSWQSHGHMGTSAPAKLVRVLAMVLVVFSKDEATKPSGPEHWDIIQRTLEDRAVEYESFSHPCVTVWASFNVVVKRRNGDNFSPRSLPTYSVLIVACTMGLPVIVLG